MTRFRFVLPALAALTTATIPGSLFAQGTQKVAYVAVQAVLQRTPGYAQAESVWTKESEGYQRQMTQLQSKMDSATAVFEQQSVMLSASNRAAEQQKLQTLASGLNDQVTSLRQEAAARQRELLDPIETRVMAVIEGLRAEGNFAIVFDVSNQASTIVAADTSLDLTQKAITRLTSGGESPGND
jgi:Skp family chaperone for outer membrane proteins